MSAYKVVDVFTSQPFLGNPVAVVLDGERFDAGQMQAIARWTNLSETTFLLPPTAPEADYRLRIFTPSSALPFAGHPTLGSAHAAIEAGRVTPREGRLIQECGVGLVTIRVDAGHRRLALDLPPAKVEPLSMGDVAELEAALGHPVLREIAPAIVNVGAVWIVAQMASAETVIKLQPDFARSAKLEKRLGVTGVSVFGKHPSGEAAIEVRSFAPSCGVNEDPVCGSGNGSVAVFQLHRGLLPAGSHRYTAAQGQCVGRAGQVYVSVDDTGRVMIGGACVTCINGVLND